MFHLRISWKRLWWSGLPLVIFLLSVTQVYPRALASANHGLVLDDLTVHKIQYIPQYHCLRYRKLDLIKRCRNSLYNDITKKFRQSFLALNSSLPVELGLGNTRGVWK